MSENVWVKARRIS